MTNLFTYRWYMYHLVILFVAVLLISLPLSTAAQTIVRTADLVTVETDQVVEGNFYTAGSRIRVSGEVEGDWTALGGAVTGNGTFQQDVLLLAGTTQLNGTTTGDVRIMAGEVVISDFIGGDLAVLGGSVEILSSAQVAGDVLLYVTDATIAGEVGGSVLGRQGRLRIDGPIGGDVDVRVSELTLGNRAQVAGDITYESGQELRRAQDAAVDGSISHRLLERETSFFLQSQQVITPVLIVVFAALTFFLLQRRRFETVVEHTLEKPLLFSLIGVSALLLTPIVAILLLVSVLGSLVGLVLLGLYVAFLALSLVLAVPVLGVLLARVAFQRGQVDILSIGLGSIVLYGMAIVPVLGPALVLAVLFLTLGGLVTWLYQR